MKVPVFTLFQILFLFMQISGTFFHVDECHAEVAQNSCTLESGKDLDSNEGQKHHCCQLCHSYPAIILSYTDPAPQNVEVKTFKFYYFNYYIFDSVGLILRPPIA
jgi:hypothetical protein